MSKFAEGNDRLSEREFDAILEGSDASRLDRPRARVAFKLIEWGFRLLPRPGRDVQLSMVQRGAECYGVGSSLDLETRWAMVRSIVSPGIVSSGGRIYRDGQEVQRVGDGDAND